MVSQNDFLQRYYRVTTPEGVDVRLNPDADDSSRKLGTIGFDEIVSKLDVNLTGGDPNKWSIKITRSDDGITGWVAAGSLQPASVADQEKEIERLLSILSSVNDSLKESLASNSLQIDILTKAHRSVSISFNQMLSYIDEIKLGGQTNQSRTDSNIQRDIITLIDAYKEMAQCFYAQYELSLLEEIKYQGDRKTESDHVQDDIDRMTVIKVRRRFEKTAEPLLKGAAVDAEKEYINLIKEFPQRLQGVLDKLRDEWQRVGTIAVASRALSEDSKLQALELVVDMAAYSMGLQDDRIVIVPGTAFALYFFSYIENFAVLTVPIHSVRAPWEWSIFWHELAGYLVRQVENKEKIGKAFKNNMQALGTSGDQPAVLDAVTKGNTFGRKYLEQLLLQKQDTDDIGGFEYQFEQTLKGLLEQKNFRDYDDLKAAGWSVDWIKELFEDAYSVLARGESFLSLFEDILKRQGSRDDRHPPYEIRLKVAGALLDQAKVEKELLLSNEDGFIQLVCQQLLKFIPMVNLAVYNFKKSRSTSLPQLQEKLFAIVKEKIDSSIQDWIKAVEGTDPDLYKKEQFINPDLLSDYLVDFQEIVKTKDVEKSYKEMIGALGYKELLDLSFFGVDFLSAGTIRNVKRGLDLKFTAIDNAINFIIPANLLGNTGEISFDCSGRSYKTSILNWNRAFNRYLQYLIPG